MSTTYRLKKFSDTPANAPDVRELLPALARYTVLAPVYDTIHATIMRAAERGPITVSAVTRDTLDAFEADVYHGRTARLHVPVTLGPDGHAMYGGLVIELKRAPREHGGRVELIHVGIHT